MHNIHKVFVALCHHYVLRVTSYVVFKSGDEMEEKPRNRFCEECKTPWIDEFKKVASLRKSGLLIFAHRETLNTNMEQPMTKPKIEDTYILHNAGQKELKRADYITEMSQYRTKCCLCRTVLQRVHSLLDEIKDIKRNEVLGICEHCKLANPSGKCRRCEFIVSKFLCNKVKQYEDKQNLDFEKSWLCKVNQLLHGILDSEIVCKHKLNRESSTIELEKLLQELKSRLEIRPPDINYFPTEPGSSISIIQSKEMLEKLLIKIKSDSLRKRSSDDSLFVSPSKTATSCVCKYFMDKKFEERSIEKLPQQESSTEQMPRQERAIEKMLTQQRAIEKLPQHTISKEKAKKKTPKGKTPGKENVSPEKEYKEKAPVLMREVRKRNNPRANTKEKVKKKEKETKKIQTFVNMNSLPEVIVREFIEVVEDKSESVLNCEQEVVFPSVMIKGTKVVPLNPYDKDLAPDTKLPVLFRVDAVCPEPESSKLPTVDAPTMTKTTVVKRQKSKEVNATTTNGIKYKLSDREFVEKGWTILPTSKIVRRLNIYKMEPASPKHGWFERHIGSNMMFYDTGEKLGEIDDEGRGKWFYKNGMVALDYYNAPELHAGQRYVVYSSGQELDNGKIKPLTVLASFDFLGNGVVYDHFGNVRIKYNQTEGVVIDEKIGVPGRWKWHSLNDPPILEEVFAEPYNEGDDPCLDNLLKKHNKSQTSSYQDKDDIMEAIELDNILKAQAHKLRKKFKPFQIRMKALKINEQFSLRVLDQTHIYLLLRDGRTSLKLNLGMVLTSNIVDTATVDVASDVVTP